MMEAVMNGKTGNILEFHRRTLVIDLHSDIQIEWVRKGSESNSGSHLLPLSWKKIGLGGINACIASTVARFGYEPYPYFTSPSHNMLQLIDATYEIVSQYPDQLAVVTDTAGLRAAVKGNRLALILGMEGSEPLQGDLSLLRNFYRLGVRVVTLAWTYRNLVAGSCSESTGCGLSDFGRTVVAEMSKLGMLIDLSHVSEQTFWDVMKIYKGPVIASHSNARTICNHFRNLSDSQIKAIADRGGVIGVTFFGEFVDNRIPTVEKIVDHIEYITNLVGVEHVGIGADWVAHSGDVLATVQNRLGSTISSSAFEHPMAQGLETADRLPNLTQALFERGYTPEQVTGILGLNALQVLERVLG